MNGFNETDNENENKNSHGMTMYDVIEDRNKTANKVFFCNFNVQ